VDAAIGFRARTGRAIAVVLTGDEPTLLWRGEVTLADPAAEGPYHQVMELPWGEAQVAVRELVSAIEALAQRAVRDVIADMKSKGIVIRAAGVVGSPQRNLDRIGNPHIRAHAAEGVLFRRVLELAAERNRLSCAGFTERDLSDVALTMKQLARAAGPPWRTDERLAAAAAWMALAEVRSKPPLRCG